MGSGNSMSYLSMDGPFYNCSLALPRADSCNGLASSVRVVTGSTRSYIKVIENPS